MTSTNGRIRLTWDQALAMALLLASILGAWYDTRTQLALLRQEVAMRFASSDDEHARLWGAVREARADRR